MQFIQSGMLGALAVPVIIHQSPLGRTICAIPEEFR